MTEVAGTSWHMLVKPLMSANTICGCVWGGGEGGVCYTFAYKMNLSPGGGSVYVKFFPLLRSPPTADMRCCICCAHSPSIPATTPQPPDHPHRHLHSSSPLPSTPTAPPTVTMGW